MQKTQKIVINGGKILKGDVYISGSKNSTLPILAASILCDDKLKIANIPMLLDVDNMIALLKHLGLSINMIGKAGPEGSLNSICEIGAGKLTSLRAPYEMVSQMRASILVLGPMLAKYGKAEVSLPGGCAIGSRPVNMHIEVLSAMGADIKLENGYVIAKAKSADGRLIGCDYTFDKRSVGATENAIIAATLANGKTILRNVAQEPEIVDLANFLTKCGAKIKGAGSEVIEIEGVRSLGGCEHQIIGDRIEAGTYAVLAGITKGRVVLHNIDYDHIENTLLVLERIGLKVSRAENNSILVEYQGRIRAIDIVTAPYPSFPTDMQAQMMSLLCIAEGESHIEESIFESRFMHVPELTRMGVDIDLIHGNLARVRGVKKFNPADVRATDLRASASLVLAGLAASGTTVVREIHHLLRGYSHLVEKCQALGADIELVEE